MDTSERSSDDQEERIFDAAIRLPSRDRPRFLDGACGDDDALRARVEELLRYAESADSTDDLAGQIRDLRISAESDRERRHRSQADLERWREFLEHLRSRGPAHDRYEMKGEIARGGMGVIHRVYDRVLERPLAMKVLDSRHVSLNDDASPIDGEALGRFLEEARITGQLDHPGIVPVHDIGLDAEGRLFFVMKLVKGNELRKVLERVADPGDRKWTLTRALDVFVRICEAMAYLHSKGVVHRDLKPGNVMVGHFGEVYVMDWGLARLRGWRRRESGRRAPGTRDEDDAATSDPSVTRQGDIIGTPAYMPPEQAMGRLDEIGPAVDVYAVGAMLYHLLAGHMPYATARRAADRDLIEVVRAGPPTPLSDAAPDAPTELVSIVEKAMARRQADRYRDMTELERDLRAFLDGHVVLAHGTGAWPRIKKWVARHKALALAVAAVVVATGVTIGITLVAVDIASQRDVAEKQRQRATDERDQVFGLADRRQLDELLASLDSLWPPRPDRIGAMDRWIADAESLLERLPDHEAVFAELNALAIPEIHDVETGDAGTTDVPRDEPARDGLKWQVEEIRHLLDGLRAIAEDDVHGRTVARVRFDRRFAATVEERTIQSNAARASWDRASAAIAEHPRYGFALSPQLGLLPLGPDPESGLWEFWHVRSGARPERNEKTGRWRVTVETGIILVLVPGGTFWMGAQSSSDEAPNYDPHAESHESNSMGQVVSVTLSPFFLSKYEMTQAQWERMTGTRPSGNKTPIERRLAHPVERMACDEARYWLPRFDLVLPTEAQWEYGARAGTSTPWWTGSDPRGVPEAGHFADVHFNSDFFAKDAEPNPIRATTRFNGHLPVGYFRPNPFGLHDTIGNVWEWCRDEYSGRSYDDAPATGDGARDARTGQSIYRGGGWGGARATSGSGTRSAYRAYQPGHQPSRYVGVRPARPIDPSRQ